MHFLPPFSLQEGLAVKTVLEMKGIRKEFPGVVANDDISLEIQAGEIHALVGENGSGKSTLMNILYGLYEADKGEIFIKGKKTKITDPRLAIDMGIGMVFQHFMLVEPLTVAENVILGNEEVHRGVFVDYKKAVREVRKLAEDFGMKVYPESKVENISVGLQQRVEIIKALYRGAEILVLDEPTAVLTPQEVDDLFRVMNKLREQGTTIIFITHKIREVLEISDRVTVLRRGQKVGTRKTSETNRQELAEMMVGREVLLRVDKEESKPGEEVARISNLSIYDSQNTQKIKDVSLTIYQGEVLGIAGVEGNGQQELVEAITGLQQVKGGEIYLKGKPLAKQSVLDTKKTGLGYIPEDRHKRGLILDYDVADNMILGYHTRPPFVHYGQILDYKAIRANARQLVKEFDVRPPREDVVVSKLSGGNQQKVIVAREFSQKPDFLICSQPTRGLDIGAIEFIHQQIIHQRDQGTAVLLVSAELDEILSLSDRIAVMYEGEIVAILPAQEATEHKLGYLMLGGKLEDYEQEGGTAVEPSNSQV